MPGRSRACSSRSSSWSNLPAKARTLLLDQVPIERLVAALKGTDAAFQAAILSSLAARSRRMVEAELQGGGSASERESWRTPGARSSIPC